MSEKSEAFYWSFSAEVFKGIKQVEGILVHFGLTLSDAALGIVQSVRLSSDSGWGFRRSRDHFESNMGTPTPFAYVLLPWMA